MRTQPAITFGRIALTPSPPTARPQVGGRRPPRDPYDNRRSSALPALLTPRKGQRSRGWLRSCRATGLGGTVAAAMLGSVALAQPANSSLPDLSGTYRCEGGESGCGWSGRTFTVTQSGSELQIKNEKGDSGNAKLTSGISLSAGPTWNMLGVIGSPDNRVIQWSNGTAWRKQ